MIIIIRILIHQPLSTCQPNRGYNLLQKATFVKPENKQTINLEERQTMSNVRLLYYGPDVPCVSFTVSKLFPADEWPFRRLCLISTGRGNAAPRTKNGYRRHRVPSRICPLTDSTLLYKPNPLPAPFQLCQMSRRGLLFSPPNVKSKLKVNVINYLVSGLNWWWCLLGWIRLVVVQQNPKRRGVVQVIGPSRRSVSCECYYFTQVGRTMNFSGPFQRTNNTISSAITAQNCANSFQRR